MHDPEKITLRDVIEAFIKSIEFELRDTVKRLEVVNRICQSGIESAASERIETIARNNRRSNDDSEISS